MSSHPAQADLPTLPLNIEEIVSAIAIHKRRVLLFGPMGVGKSTLARQLAIAFAQQQRTCWCLNADPGTPAFGAPGAVSLAQWDHSHWQVTQHAALCTLDAGRFRLPLISALRALVPLLPDALILIDAPGVVRGVAGKELLAGMVEALAIDAVLALTAAQQPPHLQDELQALPVEVYVIHTQSETARPGKGSRAQHRTAQWEAYLTNATTQHCDLAALNVIGTPPPRDEQHAWIGRQVALIQADRTLAMGEVLQFRDKQLSLRVSGDMRQADTLLIRDVIRNQNGMLETATPFAAKRYEYLPPADVIPGHDIGTGPRIAGRVGALDIGLINGVFGDPLLHLRLRHQRRSLLFDLGDASRLPARIAHQLSDIFISHAHFPLARAFPAG